MSLEKISIVIPVLNDVDALKNLLPELQEYRQQGHEVLLVDGGSSDGSLPFARTLVDRVLMTGTGRGRQMNLGAENAKHSILLFLHADSILPNPGISALLDSISASDKCWGRFDVKLNQTGIAYSIISSMMNLRSRLSGVATGDQGIFVKHDVFHRIGGFQSIPLMEDIALSKALRKMSNPICLSATILTSARRWQQQGLINTVVLMWYLRFAYFIGIKPEKLASLYYPSLAEESDNKRDY